ncbi:MAG: EamA family transporter, partial [Thiolinea sp.]
MFIKIAVTEIPPLTLIAIRVAVAATFLYLVMAIRRASMPKDAMTWRRLFIQAVFNSIGAWTVLVWGQQFIDAGLAGVLNSTTPIFVFFFTFFI